MSDASSSLSSPPAREPRAPSPPGTETRETSRDDDGVTPAARQDPIRRITLLVLALCAVIFVWYLLADRQTPYTDQARVQSLTVPIVPRVSGYVTRIDVRLHSVVEAGDTLLQLDPRPFDLAVEAAEANLERTIQELGAKGASVKSATARVGVARAQLDRAQRNFDRTQVILEKNPGALSQADRDRAETGLAQAVERVASAEADLERAQEQLGIEGPENPQLRAAIVALEQAELDRAFSSLLAPDRGVIENFTIDLGHYAAAGQPLATFLSEHDIWIQADLRENNLAHIEPGDDVEFALDVAPGRVFPGEVRSIGYGVGSVSDGSRGSLPTVSSSKGWLRDPQRFPVIIGFDQDQVGSLRRAGGQADVVVYTGGNFVLNTIAWLQIRLRSWLSYVR